MLEVLEYLFDRLKAPYESIRLVHGQPYAMKADGTLGNLVQEVPPQFVAPTLEVSTLTGFVDAYKARLDGFEERAAVHVRDHLTVELVALDADEYGRRHVWVRAKHVPETKFVFGQYYKTEDFLIGFRSAFYFNEHAVKVQKLLSSLSDENTVEISDDGMSQAVTVKVGAVTRSTVEIPADGVPLIPWRTFREAAPAESKYLLRLKQAKGELPLAALFEIDAKWKGETMLSIGDYLKKQIDGATIIS